MCCQEQGRLRWLCQGLQGQDNDLSVLCLFLVRQITGFSGTIKDTGSRELLVGAPVDSTLTPARDYIPLCLHTCWGVVYLCAVYACMHKVVQRVWSLEEDTMCLPF